VTRERAAERFYRGLWRVLVDWFKVPETPPALPVAADAWHEVFHPAPGFLRYLKFWFWFALVAMDVALVALWIAITIQTPLFGVLSALPMLILLVAPEVVAYVAIHLRYDTMWYALTDRAIRIRRGIWVIKEMTLTMENIQNVKVTRGPVMKFFGIQDLIVETAGSGATPGQSGGMNQGVIEGVADAARIRDLILARLRASPTAGLGDDAPGPAPGRGWTPAHLDVLREIAAEASRLGR
jgi:membrane protein YdbS with pleckstrin-like domain